MMWLLTFVGSKVGRLVASALAALATILLVFNAGRRDVKKDLQVENLKDYKKVKEAEDAVDTDLDRNARIERMRGNGNVRKD
jgi:hypothetical protein